MTTPNRLHTAAVDAAFAHGHVETRAECEARERPWLCVRDIALFVDNVLLDAASAAGQARGRLSGEGFDPAMAHGHLIGAMIAEAKARALRIALEVALKSHGRHDAYLVAKRALDE